MQASHRTGEITYYEELGVASGASPEEIRDAFRALARLLHPDQHMDPQLKKIAEAQMRKLNRIYAVLSDVERRREYDEFLEEEYGPAIPEDRPFLSAAVRRRLARGAWIAGTLGGLALLIWVTAENTPSPQNRAHEPATPAAQAATSPSAPPGAATNQTSVIAGLRSDLKAMKLERDAAVRELVRLRGTGAPESSSTVSASTETAELRLPALTMTELPSPARLPLPPIVPPSRAERPANRKLAGFWFYAPPPQGQHNKNQSLYPPEYIETTITEEGGVLHGKYRARFHIVDRAISPDVNFTFSGSSAATTPVTYMWTGVGGAKGELTLKLVADNSLRIDWNATELGSQQGLDAGTAVLTRRIE